MRRTLVLLALLASAAQAQVASDTRGRHGPVGQPSAVVLHAPLSQSGLPFIESATTVAHAYWMPVFNFLPQSETLCTAGVANFPWQALGVVACAANALGAMDRLTGTGTGAGYAQSAPTTLPSTSALVLSFDAAPDGSSSVSATLRGSLIGVDSCTCTGGCTTAISSGTCKYLWTGLTGTTRLTATANLTVAQTAHNVGLYPGDQDAAGVKSAYFGRVQIVPAAYVGAGAYVATTGSVVRAPGFIDTKGNAWTNTSPATGIAPRAGPFVPGIGGVQGAPFVSNTNYKLGGGSDPLDVANFRACVAFLPAEISAQSFLGNGNGTTTGYTAGITAGGACTVQMGTGTVTTTNVARANSPNVCCFGRSGTTGSVRLNYGPVAAGVVSASVDTARTANLLTADAGGAGLNGTGYEFVFDASAWTDAWGLDQVAQFTGLRTTRGNNLSFIRATPATYMANALDWPASAYWPRIESSGLLVEPDRTNYVLASEDLTAASYATTGTCAITANQGPAAWTDLDLVNCTGSNTDNRGETTGNPTASTIGPVTSCWWVAAQSGTATATVTNFAGSQTMSGATCYRSDGGACTAVNGGVVAYAYATVGTTPVRLCLASSAASAQTLWQTSVFNGQRSASIGAAILAGRVQKEIGAAPSSYLRTTGTAVTRNSDQVIGTWPAMPDVARWCAKVTSVPYAGRPWSTSPYGSFIEAGAVAAGNTMRFLIPAAGTNLDARVYNSAATLRQTQGAHGWAAGSMHTPMICLDRGVAVRSAIDGVPFGATTTTPSLNEWSAAPTNFYVGGTAGAGAALAYLRDLKICASGVAARCR